MTQSQLQGNFEMVLEVCLSLQPPIPRLGAFNSASILWMVQILHHFETWEAICVLVFTGESYHFRGLISVVQNFVHSINQFITWSTSQPLGLDALGRCSAASSGQSQRVE